MFEGYSEKGQGSEERGPGTFTFQPPGVVESRPVGGQAVQATGGIRGGGVIGNTAAPINLDSAGADRTIQALLKFGSDMIAPQLKAAREEQFLVGVQRAASGEALTEIVNERPWFSRIFGDGPLIEGARSYEVEAKASQWVTGHEENMDKLRTQSPEHIPAYLMESMKQHLTGDPATDALIKANMVKVVSGLIKRQTKEHYKYLQERTSEQRTNAMISAADSLASMRKADPGMYGNEDFDNAEANLLAVSTPTEGADPKSFWHDFKGVLGVLAEKGNFHAINAYGKAGVFSNIPAAERATLERQLNQFQAYHASEASEQYAVQIAKIKTSAHGVGPNGMPLISANDVVAQFDAINKDYTERTGNPALIIKKPEQVSTMVTAAQALASYQNAAQKAMGKEKDTVVLSSLVDQQIKQNNYAGARKQGNMPASDVDQRFYEMYKANPDVKMLVYNAAQGNGDEGVNPQVRRELASLVQSGNIGTYSPNFQSAYEQWKSIYRTPAGGAEAAAKYFSPTDSARMLAYDNALQNRDHKLFGEAAFQSTLKVRMDPGHTWSPTEQPELTKHIKKHYPGLNAEGQRVVNEAAAREMGWTKHNSGQPIVDSLAAAKASGVEAAGEHAWLTEGSTAGVKPYQSFLQMPDGAALMDQGTLDKTFNQTVANIRAQVVPKDKVKMTRIWRAADANGEAVFRMYVTDDKDQVYPLEFSTANVRGEHLRNTQNKLKPAAPVVYKGSSVMGSNPISDSLLFK